MLALEFFAWWYGQGWRGLAKNMRRRVHMTAQMFSAPILLKTLFAPWRRIVTTPGAGIDAKMRAIGDNMVSRAVGFTVRVLVLLSAGIMLLIVGIVAIVELVAWPLLPAIAVLLLVKGLAG
ncbi:MAG TPA: hypothetical protein VGG13_02595 [Candidatus Saccharimonadales bacterium]|jgi:hypothetical protein